MSCSSKNSGDRILNPRSLLLIVSRAIQEFSGICNPGVVVIVRQATYN
ncbi:MAG: hypothetical protein MET45_28580 [Nostoc sp. LLA-1]|nr:hypothetical protein [Cyanocohniella sp. LLY]